MKSRLTILLLENKKQTSRIRKFIAGVSNSYYNKMLAGWSLLPSYSYVVEISIKYIRYLSQILLKYVACYSSLKVRVNTSIKNYE